jgi:excisionase family DNA binding protein
MVAQNLKRMPRFTRWDQLPILLDVPLVCVVFGMSEMTVKRLANRGELPGARKVGDQWRFDKEALHDYILGKEGGA